MFSHGLPELFPGALFGVDIFFVLSGYLITTLLLVEYARHGRVDFLSFYARRALRLLPALLLVLVSVSLICVVLKETGRFGKDMLHSTFLDGLIALLFATNWARVLTSHGQGLFSHTWSLSVEEQFYLLWPLLLLLGLRCTRRRWPIALGTAVLTFIAWAIRDWQYRVTGSLDVAFVTRVEPVLIGCVLALLLDERSVFDLLLRWRKFIAVAAPMAAVLLLGYITTWLRFGPGFVIVGVLTAVLVLDVLINPASFLSRMLSARWLVWVGSISYGLYLWHFPIYGLGNHLAFSELQVAIFGSVLAVTLAACSYWTIERHALEYKQRFAVGAAVIKEPRESLHQAETGR